jgi:hypothetical protein
MRAARVESGALPAWDAALSTRGTALSAEGALPTGNAVLAAASVVAERIGRRFGELERDIGRLQGGGDST